MSMFTDMYGIFKDRSYIFTHRSHMLTAMSDIFTHRPDIFIDISMFTDKYDIYLSVNIDNSVNISGLCEDISDLALSISDLCV
jgi:hypothetical protein